MKKILKRRRGSLKMSSVFFFFVVVAGCIPFYQLGVPEWNYVKMLHKMTGAVNELKLNTPESIREGVKAFAKECNLPDEFYNKLKVNKETSGPDARRMVVVSSQWTDTVMLFGRYKVEFHREIDVRKALWK